MSEWGPAVAIIVAVLGGFGGIAALLKIRPEAGQVVVSAAEGAVVVQTRVIDNLKSRMSDLETQLSEQDGEIEFLKSELEKCNKHRNGVIATAEELKERVKHLEDRSGGTE